MAYDGVEFHTLLTSILDELSDQHHMLIILPLEKDSSVLIEQETGCAPEQFWM